MPTTPASETAWRNSRIFAWLMTVGVPVVFLVVTQAWDRPAAENDAAHQMMLYMLLPLAMIQPALYGLIEKSQIRSFRDSNRGTMTAAAVLQTLSIIKCAFVEAIYIYGFVLYAIGAGLGYMLYFYVVGAIWTLLYWPRRARFDSLQKKMETV